MCSALEEGERDVDRIGLVGIEGRGEWGAGKGGDAELHPSARVGRDGKEAGKGNGYLCGWITTGQRIVEHQIRDTWGRRLCVGCVLG